MKTEEIIFGRKREDMERPFLCEPKDRFDPSFVRQAFITSFEADIKFFSSHPFLRILKDYNEEEIEELCDNLVNFDFGSQLLTRQAFIESFKNAALNILIQEVALGFLKNEPLPRNAFEERLLRLTESKERTRSMLAKFDRISAKFEEDRAITEIPEETVDILDRQGKGSPQYEIGATAATMRFIHAGLKSGMVQKRVDLAVDGAPTDDYFSFKLPFADLLVFFQDFGQASSYCYQGDNEPWFIEIFKRPNGKFILYPLLKMKNRSDMPRYADVFTRPDENGRFLVRLFGYGLKDTDEESFRDKIGSLRHEYHHALNRMLIPASTYDNSSFSKLIAYGRMHLVDELAALALTDNGEDIRIFKIYLDGVLEELNGSAVTDENREEVRKFESDWAEIFALLDDFTELYAIVDENNKPIVEDARPLSLIIYQFICTAQTMRQVRDRLTAALRYILASLVEDERTAAH